MKTEGLSPLALLAWGLVLFVVVFLLAGYVIMVTWNGVNDALAPGTDLTYGQGVLAALLVSCLGGMWRPMFEKPRS